VAVVKEIPRHAGAHAAESNKGDSHGSIVGCIAQRITPASSNYTNILKLRIRNETRNVALATRADIADTSAKRRTGLLKRESLAEGEGLWIVPCEGVHTFGMAFAIDVIFLSKQRKVLKVRESMPPRRIALSLFAHSVLELPAGVICATGTAVGDQLEFEKLENSC
jgi:uncharacterized membrane protein (UPF0127 family)